MGWGGWGIASGLLVPARKPVAPGRGSLRDNQMAFDQEDFRRQFWGLHGSLQGLPLDGVGELYLLGLHERDSARRATRNRRLYTSGFRWSRKPATGRFHYDWESALQVGTSRATRAFADTSDLNHLAHMHSIEVGYTLEAPTTPRMALIHEYASGDRDPFDAGNNRFDTLYGARRFAHGPTGIWGAFARSNINSPGYLLSLSPLPDIRLMVKHRFYWLASRRDAWTTTGVRDVTGNFGNLVGHQVESRLRWEALPGNLRVEIGIAHLFDNEFIQSGTNEGAVTYGYGQCILTF